MVEKWGVRCKRRQQEYNNTSDHFEPKRCKKEKTSLKYRNTLIFIQFFLTPSELSRLGFKIIIIKMLLKHGAKSSEPNRNRKLNRA